MGKYDALMTAVPDEEIQDKYGDLMAAVPDDEPAPVATPPQPGILSRIGDKLKKRGEGLMENAARNQGYLRTQTQYPLQQVGELAGAVNDVVGEVAMPVLKAEYKGASKIASNKVAQNLPFVGAPLKILNTLNKYAPSAVSSVAGSKPAQGLQAKWEKLEKEHPNIAEDIRAVANIAGFLPVGKGGQIAKNATVETVKGTVKGTGEGLKSFAKVGQGKSWKLTGTPEQVAAKRDVAAANDIWGNSRKAADELQPKLSEKYNNLKNQIIKHGEENDIKVSIIDQINEAEQTALRGASPTKKTAIQNTFEAIRNDAMQEFGNNPVSLADVQIYKQKVGDWADDAFDVTMKGRPVTAQPAEHQAYLSLYDKIKNKIENVGPEGVKEANKELSVMLDLRRDLRKRIAVEERNKFMPLDEVVSASVALGSLATGNLGPAALYGAQVASRSPNVLRGLYKTGKFLTPPPKAVQKYSDLYKMPVASPEVAATARNLRLTPQKLQAIEKQLDAEEAAARASGDAETIAKINQLRDEINIENLPKSPVLTPERLRQMAAVNRAVEPDKISGDVASWHKLSDNWMLNKAPKATIGDKIKRALKDETGAVGGVNPQVHSENFKKWFGDWEKAPEQASKVLDENGKPLVVYHGTTSVFNSFSPKKLGLKTNANSAKQGFFFTNDPETAGSYLSLGKKEKAIERKQFNKYFNEAESLKFKHTNEMDLSDTYRKIIDDKDLTWYNDEAKKRYEKLNDLMGKHSKVAQKPANIKPVFLDIKKPYLHDFKGATFLNRDRSFSNIITEAKSNGYDGVVLKNVYDGGKKPSDIYVAFSPTQIKSAIGNSGAFNPANPDIRGNSALGTLGLTAGVAGGGLALGELNSRRKAKR